jgi:hypothetical protein
MSNIIEWIKDKDNELVATIVLFVVGILIVLFGVISIALTSSGIFIVFGSLLMLMGVIIVIFGFVTLMEFLGGL